MATNLIGEAKVGGISVEAYGIKGFDINQPDEKAIHESIQPALANIVKTSSASAKESNNLVTTYAMVGATLLLGSIAL